MFDGDQVFVYGVLEYGKGQFLYGFKLLLRKPRCLEVKVAHFLFIKSVLGAVLSNGCQRLLFGACVAHRSYDNISVNYLAALQLYYRFLHAEVACVVHAVAVGLFHLLHCATVGVSATVGVVALDNLAKLVARLGASVGAFKVFVVQLHGSFCKVA